MTIQTTVRPPAATTATVRGREETGGTYRHYGLRVASPLPLPLPSASGAGPPDVRVTLGPVAIEGELLQAFDEPIRLRAYRQEDAVVLDWPGVACAIGPDRVTIDSERPEVAAHLLLAVVWSLVLDLRGRPSLHGSAVERNGRALAVMGVSGSGKSTATLAMLDRGWRLVSDDLLTFAGDGAVLPGPGFVRLTADRAVGRAGTVDIGGKLRYAAPTCPEPTPLAAIVVHGPNFAPLERLRGAAAVNALVRQAYTPVPTLPEPEQRRFRLAVDLATRVPVYGTPPRSLDPDALAKLLEGNPP